ncbi:putative bifunctional diguanylate cyclase/phosphodiesterase [Novosphingobium nitrogenifigens]|nr:EAL domain-containing protein [Novosphingobium nitrogenifigens]
MFNLADDRVRLLLDTIPVALSLEDGNGRRVSLNRESEALWGEAGPAALRDLAARAIPLRSVQPCDCAAGDDCCGEREDVIWDDERQACRTLRTLRRAIFDEHGQLRHMLNASVDITESKRLELELRDSEKKLRGLFELCPLGIALTTMDGAYLEFNEAFCRICGYSPDEIRKLDYWALTPRKYAEAEQIQLRSLLEFGHYGPYEKEYIRKDGCCVPLRLTGVLLQGSDGKSYIWSIIEDVTEQRKSQEAIWRHANFDMMTGLPNRRMFYERLERDILSSAVEERRLAVIFLDFDNFKEINDAFGHDKGDEVLREAARRLKSHLRESDVIGRLSGDEFTLILRSFRDDQEIDNVVQRLLATLSEPYRFGADILHASASVGIAVYPDDGAAADELIRHADQAMYEAKAQGQGRFSHFHRELQEEASHRSRMAMELRHALVEKQFRLYYQPIVALDSGEVLKAEALLRWEHPRLGLIGGGDFIPVAEQAGSIHAIGQWVFEEAANQVARWDRAGCPPIQLGINRSPVEFRRPDNALDAWTTQLAQLGLCGSRFVVEITEGLLVEQTPVVRGQLEQLGRIGSGLALDDFGTGYSSLSYLRKFDVDFLKIDRSFVQGLAPGSEDLALCEAMIVMAEKLGIKVIAEGIETEQQRDLLAAAGCHFGQGYWFGRPMPAEAFTRRLLQGKGVVSA